MIVLQNQASTWIPEWNEWSSCEQARLLCFQHKVSIAQRGEGREKVDKRQGYRLEARYTVSKQLGIISTGQQQRVCGSRVEDKHGSHIVGVRAAGVQVQPLLWSPIFCRQAPETGHLKQDTIQATRATPATATAALGIEDLQAESCIDVSIAG